MKVYRTSEGILIEKEGVFYLKDDQNWNRFINDDDLYGKIERIISSSEPEEQGPNLLKNGVQAPVQDQEVWASGVTYYNSKLGRQEESKTSGGGDFYARVYDAERPELFFKATAHRTAGPGEMVTIREDSSWDVPEPELTLVITSNARIVGYTIGNDMSSRSIEGENPLYLPQAKTWDGSASVGPCVYVTNEPLPPETQVEMEIVRGGSAVFKEAIAISQIKRSFSDLVAYLYRACSFPHGSLLMTGTGIVPAPDFTLEHDDEIRITIEPIGTLINRVK